MHSSRLKCTNQKKFIRFLIIILIFLIGLFIFIINQINISNLLNIDLNSKNLNGGLLTNDKYSGIGRQPISGKDGYFSTFSTAQLATTHPSDLDSVTTSTPSKDTLKTTSSYSVPVSNSKNVKIYKEYKQNGDSSWSNKQYWDSIMANEGCGITSISIILSGYNKDYTPEDLRKKYYPVLSGDKISSELSNTFNISNSDFYYDETHLSSQYILNHLQTNRPVLICVWNKPTANRWTTASHYMVLLACDNSNLVYVSNPNGLDNTNKNSGWYNIDEVTPYIAKALFIEE